MISRYQIKEIIKSWRDESGICDIFTDRKIMYRLSSNNKLSIYTSCPGFLIGKAGHLYNKYEELLKGVGVSDVELIETHVI